MLTPRVHDALPPQARVMMGPEEVLIRGGNVSVNGQLVPEGESRLLPGKGQSTRPQGGAQKGSREQLGTAPTALGRHLELWEPAEKPEVVDLVPKPTAATHPH